MQLRFVLREAPMQGFVLDLGAQRAHDAAVDAAEHAHHHRAEHRHHQREQRIGAPTLQRELQHGRQVGQRAETVERGRAWRVDGGGADDVAADHEHDGELQQRIAAGQEQQRRHDPQQASGRRAGDETHFPAARRASTAGNRVGARKAQACERHRRQQPEPGEQMRRRERAPEHQQQQRRVDRGREVRRSREPVKRRDADRS